MAFLLKPFNKRAFLGYIDVAGYKVLHIQLQNILYTRLRRYTMEKRRIGKLNIHKGSQCWYVRIDGKMKYITSKGASREQAELALAQIRLELHAREKDGPNPDSTAITTLFQLYLDRVKGETSPKNYSDKLRVLTDFMLYFGTHSLSDVTPLQIEDWLKQRPARTSGGGRRNAFAHLASAFNWLSKKVRTTYRPHVGATRPPDNVRGEEYVWSEEEYEKIRDGLVSPYRDALTILWKTGWNSPRKVDTELRGA
jgi:hypothetical protein